MKFLDEHLLERSCPLCSAPLAQGKRKLYGPSEWRMTQCGQCDMVYLGIVVDPKYLFTDFSWEKTSKQEDSRREKTHGPLRKLSRMTRGRMRLLPRKSVLKLLDEFLPSGGDVLDVGCGDGGQVANLPKRYRPHGIEISTELSQKAQVTLKDKGGVVVNNDALNGLRYLSESCMDVVVMRSFLEHDIHPKEVAEECYRVLRMGGTAIIKVPNYGCWNRYVRGNKWCGFRYPDHVNYFTPVTIQSLLTRSGFEISRFNFIDRFPTSDNMWIFARKS